MLQESGAEGSSKNLYRGNICPGRLALEMVLHRSALGPPALLSLSARRIQDARTQRERRMTNVLEPSNCSLEAPLSRFWRHFFVCLLLCLGFVVYFYSVFILLRRLFCFGWGVFGCFGF